MIKEIIKIWRCKCSKCTGNENGKFKNAWQKTKCMYLHAAMFTAEPMRRWNE